MSDKLECDYCSNPAELVIIKVVQPSPPHPSCLSCAGEMREKGYVVTDFKLEGFENLPHKRIK